MRSSLGWLLGASTAVVVASSLYWLVGDPLLAAVTGLVWGVGLGLTSRLYRKYPSYTTDTDWRHSRWIGLGTGVITLAALLGVSPSLPISAELRLGLGALVIGTGLAATTTATLAQAERSHSPATADETTASTPEATDTN